MTQTIKNLMIFVSLLALTSCNGFVSPEGVLGVFYESLIKNKYSQYKRTLTQPAREIHGNRSEMKRFQSRLAGYEFTIGEIKLLSTREDVLNNANCRSVCGKHDEHTYWAEIVGRKPGQDYQPLQYFRILCKDYSRSGASTAEQNKQMLCKIMMIH